MLSTCCSLFQPAPAWYNMGQRSNQSLRMLKTNRPLVGEANMGSMRQVAISDRQMRKAISAVKAQKPDGISRNNEAEERATNYQPPTEKKKEKEKQNTVTRSLIKNFTEGEVVVRDKKHWSERVMSDYENIEKGKCSGFHHKGENNDPDGSKGAVVYAGKANKKDVAFLLAWHSDPYADANKVYVKCGNLDDYETINWDEIEKQLNATHKCNDHDRHEITGAELSADTTRSGIDPALDCVFDVKN